jgi:hypothetical protein
MEDNLDPMVSSDSSCTWLAGRASKAMALTVYVSEKLHLSFNVFPCREMLLRDRVRSREAYLPLPFKYVTRAKSHDPIALAWRSIQGTSFDLGTSSHAQKRMIAYRAANGAYHVYVGLCGHCECLAWHPCLICSIQISLQSAAS